jgi:hypothetical protein
MAKFKVGDFVRLIYAKKTRFHVTGIMEDTCVAGTQIHYFGRCYFVESGYGVDASPAKEIGKFAEIELEPIPETSTELVELIKQRERIRLEKEVLIKAQDFEKASYKRDEERALGNKIELLRDLE